MNISGDLAKAAQVMDTGNAVFSGVSNKVAAGGFTGLAGSVLVWGLGQVHVNMPPDVAVSIVTLASALAAWYVPHKV